MKILNKLKEIRWEQNLSTRDLARMSGVSHSMISKVENGMVQPTQITMMLISKGLNLKVEEVFILDYNQL